MKDLGEFVEMANTWCLNNFTACARHKIRAAGEIPDVNLHPEGHHLT